MVAKDYYHVIIKQPSLCKKKHFILITLFTGKAVTPQQVDKVGRCNIQVDMLEIKQG